MNILVIGCLKGMFTGKKLSDFNTFASMRRVVNGTDKASLIAGYAESFLRALEAVPLSQAPEVPPETPPTGLAGLLAAIVKFILSLFRR